VLIHASPATSIGTWARVSASLAITRSVCSPARRGYSEVSTDDLSSQCRETRGPRERACWRGSERTEHLRLGRAERREVLGIFEHGRDLAEPPVEMRDGFREPIARCAS
jgi:hypothetical protein